MRCPDCGSSKIKRIENEFTCKTCGAVLGETYFSGSRII